MSHALAPTRNRGGRTHDTAWARTRSCHVHRSEFGRSSHRPPITAVVAGTRDRAGHDGVSSSVPHADLCLHFSFLFFHLFLVLGLLCQTSPLVFCGKLRVTARALFQASEEAQSNRWPLSSLFVYDAGCTIFVNFSFQILLLN